MKLVGMKCPLCGGQLKADEYTRQTTCPFCGTSILLEDENMPGDSEQAGYQFEKGRIKAQLEHAAQQAEAYREQVRTRQAAEQKNKKAVWWIVGFILCCPLAFTVLIITNKRLKPSVKAAVLAGFWLILGLYYGLSFAHNGPVIRLSGPLSSSRWEAEVTPIEDFNYHTDDSSVIISRYTGADEKVRIADSYEIGGNIYKVETLEDVFNKTELESVIIPEGVKSIGENAFRESHIDYLFLPSTLEEFDGWSAFSAINAGKKLYFGGTEAQLDALYKGNRNRLYFGEIIFNAVVQER